MKTLSKDITLSITTYGDLHITIQSASVILGEPIINLEVFPKTAGTQESLDFKTMHAEERLREAERLQRVISVNLKALYLVKALQAAPLTSPDKILIGIPSEKLYVHVLMSYKSMDSMNHGPDEKKGLFFRLPVMEDL